MESSFHTQPLKLVESLNRVVDDEVLVVEAGEQASIADGFGRGRRQSVEVEQQPLIGGNEVLLKVI
jgi:hypothetical protein